MTGPVYICIFDTPKEQRDIHCMNGAKKASAYKFNQQRDKAYSYTTILSPYIYVQIIINNKLSTYCITALIR